MEEWRPVVGFEGLYEVSSEGQVRSLDRFVRTWWGCRCAKGKLRTQIKNKKGYLSVSLHANGVQATREVHVVAALAFLGPRPDGFDVAHVNGNPADNRIGNLAYKTHKENMADRVEHGTHNRGEKHPLARLSEREVQRVLRMAAAGVIQREIGKLFGVRQQQISRIVSGKRWAHVD